MDRLVEKPHPDQGPGGQAEVCTLAGCSAEPDGDVAVSAGSRVPAQKPMIVTQSGPRCQPLIQFFAGGDGSGPRPWPTRAAPGGRGPVGGGGPGKLGSASTQGRAQLPGAKEQRVEEGLSADAGCPGCVLGSEPHPGAAWEGASAWREGDRMTQGRAPGDGQKTGP